MYQSLSNYFTFNMINSYNKCHLNLLMKHKKVKNSQYYNY